MMKILGLLGQKTDEGLSGLSRLWDELTGGVKPEQVPQVEAMRTQGYSPEYAGGLLKFGEEGMTQEARMARAAEQGFEGPFYRWTEGGQGRVVRTPEVDTGLKFGPAGYASPQPDYGARYVDPTKSNVQPLMARGPLADLNEVDRVSQGLIAQRKEANLPQWPGHQQHWAEMQDALKAEGYRGVRYGDKEVASFEPEKNMRSINAVFDPEGKGGLLGGVGGATVLGGGLLATDAMNNEAEAGGLIKLLSRTVGDTPTSSFMDEPIISTRLPTAVRATEDPLTQNLIIDTASMDPAQLAKNTGLLGQAAGMRTTARSPEKKAVEFQRKLEENLLHLADELPTEFKDQAALWYDGANKIANDFSVKFERSPESVAGVIAAMSPQKDWFQNVSLAERVLDAYSKAPGKTATPEMVEKAKSIEALAKYGDDIKAMSEKPFEELTDQQKALWIRSYDETYNPKAYRKVNPDGKFQDWATKKDGENRSVAWGSLNEIKKAVSVLENPSKANISEQMGDMHKVRNFYNNIIKPSDPTSVTIDTHAVAADMVKPLSGNSPQVSYNFGTGSTNSAITGAKGTYGIHADAYRSAAAQEGILPRQMQSITWEAIRSIIPDTLKRNPEFMNRVTSVWNAADKGIITRKEARDQIIDMAGGVRLPDWYQPGLDVRNIPAKSDSTMRAAAPASLLGGGAAASVEPSPLEAEVANMMGSIGVDYREDPNFNYSMFLPWRKPKSVMYGDGGPAMPSLFRDILRGALTAEKAGKYGNDEAAIKGLLDSML
jgi:hypothetical protein